MSKKKAKVGELRVRAPEQPSRRSPAPVRTSAGSLRLAGRRFASGSGVVLGFALLCVALPRPASGELSSTPPPRADGVNSSRYLSDSLGAFPLSQGEALLYLEELQVNENVQPGAGVAASIQERLKAALSLSGIRGRLLAASSLAQALEEARSERKPLVRIAAHLDHYQLRVEVTETAFARRFWERVRAPLGIAVTKWQLALPLDASLIPRPPTTSALSSTRPISLPLKDAYAGDCSIFPGENRPQITLLGRRRIVTGTISGNQWSTIQERSLDDLSPLSGNPLREVMGRILSDGNSLLLGSSDRAKLVRVTPTLTVIETSGRAFPRYPGRCSPFVSDGIAASVAPCGTIAGTELGATESLPRHRAWFSLSVTDGSSGAASVSQGSRSSTVWLRENSGTEREFPFPKGLPSDSQLVGVASALRDSPLLFFSSAESSSHFIASYDGNPMSYEKSKVLPVGALNTVTECPLSAEGHSLAIVVGRDQAWVLK